MMMARADFPERFDVARDYTCYIDVTKACICCQHYLVRTAQTLWCGNASCERYKRRMAVDEG